MNTFVFIIPKTPISANNEFREDLFGITEYSLLKQSYDNWSAVVIGDTNGANGNIQYVKSKAISKKDKITVGIEYLSSNNIEYDYIARLDDDDVVNPHILKKLQSSNADCICDDRQLLYDVKYNNFFYAKYPWLANTIFHKREHAESMIEGGVKTEYMLTGDHDKIFDAYYSGKNIRRMPITTAIYARIYHPFTQSVIQFYNGNNSEFDWDTYEQLLKRPRRWDRWNMWIPLGPSWFSDYKKRYIKMSKKYNF